jgi:thiopurine S-methyltransferase
MDKEFWNLAWNEGRTNFHQEQFNEKLVKYFPQLNPRPGQRILVPLCGKTKDLLWLHQLNLHVHGIEFYQNAVESFFKENNFSPIKKIEEKEYIQYSYKNILISCGDFFKLGENETYNFIYDRAALVALPFELRKKYAKVIKRSLQNGGQYFLVVYEYDQTKIDGPPFSVDANEIHDLYQNDFTIKLLETDTSIKPGSKFSVLSCLKQKTYILEKII